MTPYIFLSPWFLSYSFIALTIALKLVASSPPVLPMLFSTHWWYRETDHKASLEEQRSNCSRCSHWLPLILYSSFVFLAYGLGGRLCMAACDVSSPILKEFVWEWKKHLEKKILNSEYPGSCINFFFFFVDRYALNRNLVYKHAPNYKSNHFVCLLHMENCYQIDRYILHGLACGGHTM